MLLLDTLFKPFVKKTRDRALLPLRQELGDTKLQLRQARAELQNTRERMDSMAAEIRALSRQMEDGLRANKSLAETGALVNLTDDERAGDGTRVGAPGYLSWESSVATYRPAFQDAIDYLRSEQIWGPIVEFGTYSGFTARIICELMVSRSYDVSLYLYDSFEGLPDMTGTVDASSYNSTSWTKGSMSVAAGYEKHIWDVTTKIRPADKIHIVKGFYEDTLNAGLPKERCSLIHVDCDLYSSAKYVLAKLAEKDLYQDGCVVMFDDWNCNRASPKQGERRALAEFLSEFPRWTCSQWFTYGWNGCAFFFHDRDAK